MTYKILVSDSLNEEGLKKFTDEYQVDYKTNLSQEELVEVIGEYEALLVRSGTQVTEEVLKAGKNLKVVGRAGVGTDNIAVDAATKEGILVLNAPGGNTIAAAEHAIAMMFATARKIPQANMRLKDGKWEKKPFMGVELYQKKLGILGLGRIGSEVAKRAKGLEMDVIAYDPYITEMKTSKLQIDIRELEEVLEQADFISLHLPKTEETANLINKDSIETMKDGAFIINCARGGLIDEDALYNALKEGKLAGAALDVFDEEPITDYRLVELDNVVATPHLGASTREAQAMVAEDIVEQVIQALKGEPVNTAVNVPSVPENVATDVKPYIPLARNMGSFFAQYFGGKIQEIQMEYYGDITTYPLRPLTNTFLKGIFSEIVKDQINYVNAPIIAEERGVNVVEKKSSKKKDFQNLIQARVKTDEGERVISGTLFGKHDPRFVRIGEYKVDVLPSKHLLLIDYIDTPGMIAAVSKILGANSINIAGMQVGRQSVGGDALMVMQVDSRIDKETLDEIKDIPQIIDAKACFLKD
ncbi:phosphoglycerate dehydrogenase [Natranaerofaba carboxydovora]|uniref:phosphoglycerate dehydrogenase n=1 Tax=Natranaerofaba carboxydovora TaxID=2742683 RepID=UPI001F13E5F6|nr:phosphoglycerate dehydrogenase [Natranaerofaba carboxydovora]